MAERAFGIKMVMEEGTPIAQIGWRSDGTVSVSASCYLSLLHKIEVGSPVMEEVDKGCSEFA